MKRKIIAYVVSAVMVLTMIPATAFAATDTNGGEISKTAPDAYTQAEQRADTYFNYDLDMAAYDNDGAAAVTAIVDKYTALIDATTVPATVNNYVAQATAEIGKVKTAEIIIETYFPAGKSIANYGTEGRKALEELRADAIYALGDSTSVETTNAIVVQLKADIDAVADATGEAASNIEKEKTKAKSTLDNWVNKNVYNGATYRTAVQNMIDAVINGAKTKIDAVTTDVGSVDAILENAESELADIADKYKTDAQIAYEEALDKALEEDNYAKLNDYNYNDKYPNYTEDMAEVYVGQISNILNNLDERFELYDYGWKDGSSGAAGWYNQAVRDGDVATVADVEEISATIKTEIARIPTASTYDAVVATWIYNAERADADDSYEYLSELRDQYYYKDSVNGTIEALRAAKRHAGTKAERVAIRDAWVALSDALTGYDAAHRTEVYNMADTVNKTYSGKVTDANYATVIAAVDNVIAENSKNFGTAMYTNQQMAKYKADYDVQIAAQTKKIHDFVTSVYQNAIEEGDGEYLIPTAEMMADKDFDWADYTAAMAAAKTAYDKVSATMKADPNADKYWGIYGSTGTGDGSKDDITLAKAIEVYEAAKAAYDTAATEAYAVMKLIDTIPDNYIDATDKAEVDAAIEAYNALPDSSKVFVSNAADLEKAAKDVLAKCVAAVEANFTKANGTGAASWKSLDADLIDQYNNVNETARVYGKEFKNVAANWKADNIDAAVKAYNGRIADPNNPTDANAAGSVAKIIKDIPRDPAKATEADFAAVKEARAAYDALLTDEAKVEFKRAGYLEWLERYESYVGRYDISTATITVDEKVVGSLPQVNRGTDPKVTITDASGAVVPASEYKLEYQTDNHAGLATVIATGTGSYTGEISTQFVVVNNAKKILGLKSNAKKTFTVRYNDYSKHNCTGTQIQWKTSKNGEWKYSKMTKNAKIKKISVKTSGKKWVRVRPIVNVDGERYFGDWSKVKTVNVK